MEKHVSNSYDVSVPISGMGKSILSKWRKELPKPYHSYQLWILQPCPQAWLECSDTQVTEMAGYPNFPYH